MVTVVKRSGEKDQADDYVAREHPAERDWPDTGSIGEMFERTTRVGSRRHVEVM
jgi:hypothetical protein